MKIAFVLYPKILTTGVSIPVEMVNAAVQAKGDHRTESIEMFFVAEKKGPIVVTAGMQLVADYDFNDPINADWIFIPPMWGTPWKTLADQSKLQQWVLNQYVGGSRVIATGTGVGHLVLAGLLDDKVATTHWYYLPRFQKRFNKVKFQTEHFITHQDGLYCAGSINAQTDLVLYFIDREFGKGPLALVEQQFMHELKRTFTTPFYEPGGSTHQDEIVSLAQSWMRSHFPQAITIADVAKIAGQSERQLRRRFSDATEESPQQYLQRIRIEEAQSMLRETNLTVTDIAHAIGFTNSAYFSKTFKKHTFMTPGGYRRVVRKKRFSEG